jgi:hypothetical protein
MLSKAVSINKYPEEDRKNMSTAIRNTKKTSIIVEVEGINILVFATGHLLDNCTKPDKLFYIEYNGVKYSSNQKETLFQLGKFLFGTDRNVHDLKQFCCTKAADLKLFDLTLEKAQMKLKEGVQNDEEWKSLNDFIRNPRACEEILNLLYNTKNIVETGSIAQLFFPENWTKEFGVGTTAWAGRFYGLGLNQQIWEAKKFEWMLQVICSWANQTLEFEELSSVSGNFTYSFAEIQKSEKFVNQWMASSINPKTKEDEGMNWLGAILDIFFAKANELRKIPEISDFTEL